MTGNDIADLSLARAESNWRRKGWLDKICTPAEQLYIQQSHKPDTMLWRLWTMKESAYKIFVRTNGQRSFAPLKFQCSLLSTVAGLVTHGQHVYKTNSVFTDEYIHSTASAAHAAFPPVCSIVTLPVGLCEQDVSTFINRLIIERYRQHTSSPQETIKIVKSVHNIPSLQTDSGQLIPVSITHHGRFAAFTING